MLLYRDVTDGWEYLKHKRFLPEPANVSFLLNTDGVSLFQSSNISLWPIWLAGTSYHMLGTYFLCTPCMY